MTREKAVELFGQPEQEVVDGFKWGFWRDQNEGDVHISVLRGGQPALQFFIRDTHVQAPLAAWMYKAAVVDQADMVLARSLAEKAGVSSRRWFDPTRE